MEIASPPAYDPPAVKVDVVTEIVISRSRAAVAAFAGDPGNAPRWYENMQSVEWETPPPAATGSRVYLQRLKAILEA